MRALYKILLIVIVLVIITFIFRDSLSEYFFNPQDTQLDIGAQLGDADNKNEDQDSGPRVKIIAEELEVPWDMVFLPSGDLLVTERPGRLKVIDPDGVIKLSLDLRDVNARGEGGLLGVVLHPNFDENNFLYLYLGTSVNGGIVNRVDRYVFNGEELSQKKLIINNIPGAFYHDGGRMAFGPDGMLYITTGDAGNSDLAQDPSSLAGKILRVKDNGDVPEDNPFGNEVYSYGHRNSQGITWDDQGRLWSTEHGRSGIETGLDELNLIEKGNNYGWPIIEGDEEREGMIGPVAHSGPDETWAPASVAFLDGSIFFAGLRGESLYEAKFSPGGEFENIVVHYREDFGRLRTVIVGPDGYLYVSTSNRDGRGGVNEGDDKIIQVRL